MSVEGQPAVSSTHNLGYPYRLSSVLLMGGPPGTFLGGLAQELQVRRLYLGGPFS